MQNEPAQIVPPTTTPPAQKKRHGCLTAWLILIIVGNLIGTAAIVGMATAVPEDFGGWVVPVEIILGAWTIICAIALFMWKKWGFYAFIAGAVVSMAANIALGSWFTAFTPFISVAILYWVLQIGKENKGWPQLG